MVKNHFSITVDIFYASHMLLITNLTEKFWPVNCWKGDFVHRPARWSFECQYLSMNSWNDMVCLVYIKKTKHLIDNYATQKHRPHHPKNGLKKIKAARIWTNYPWSYNNLSSKISYRKGCGVEFTALSPSSTLYLCGWNASPSRLGDEPNVGGGRTLTEIKREAVTKVNRYYRNLTISKQQSSSNKEMELVISLNNE